MRLKRITGIIIATVMPVTDRDFERIESQLRTDLENYYADLGGI